jgi:hypothetical protein
MAETLELIASCRATIVAELERTHSPREIRYCQHEIERLDMHPLSNCSGGCEPAMARAGSR